MRAEQTPGGGIIALCDITEGDVLASFQDCVV